MIKYINKIAMLVFTIFSISCAANNTSKGVKTLTNKRGETFTFHGDGTASVEYDGANLGTYLTNNNNPKEFDKVQLYKEGTNKCVYVGNLGLKGGHPDPLINLASQINRLRHIEILKQKKDILEKCLEDARETLSISENLVNDAKQSYHNAYNDSEKSKEEWIEINKKYIKAQELLLSKIESLNSNRNKLHKSYKIGDFKLYLKRFASYKKAKADKKLAEKNHSSWKNLEKWYKADMDRSQEELLRMERRIHLQKKRYSQDFKIKSQLEKYKNYYKNKIKEETEEDEKLTGDELLDEKPIVFKDIDLEYGDVSTNSKVIVYNTGLVKAITDAEDDGTVLGDTFKIRFTFKTENGDSLDICYTKLYRIDAKQKRYGLPDYFEIDPNLFFFIKRLGSNLIAKEIGIPILSTLWDAVIIVAKVSVASLLSPVIVMSFNKKVISNFGRDMNKWLEESTQNIVENTIKHNINKWSTVYPEQKQGPLSEKLIEKAKAKRIEALKELRKLES